MCIESLVSVIMPCHNGERFLADSIRSVLSQTYTNLELLITDDCSTNPETLRILKDFQKQDDRVDVVFLKDNMGPG